MQFLEIFFILWITLLIRLAKMQDYLTLLLIQLELYAFF